MRRTTRKFAIYAVTGMLVLGGMSTEVRCEHTVDGITFYGKEETQKAKDDMLTSLYAEYGLVYDPATGTAHRPGEQGNVQNQQQAPQQNANKQQSQKKTICEHSYESEVVKESTCAEKGMVKYVCSKCKQSYTEKLPLSTEHKYTSQITKEPTCTETGEETFTCLVCQDVYTEEIPMLSHDYETIIVREATCVDAGEEKTVCKLCGEETVKELQALGHQEGAWQITKEKGMFTPGEQVKKCSVCGELLETQIIESTYPMMYLYFAIGGVAILIVLLGIIIFNKSKSK